MEDTLITFETAKLAKKKGFKEGSRKGYLPNGETGISHYNSLCYNDKEDYPTKYAAPTQSLLAKWLREKYDIEINITRMPPEAIKSSFNKGNKRIKKYNMWVWSLNGNPRIENPSLFFDNYEEAFEIGLQEALQNL